MTPLPLVEPAPSTPKAAQSTEQIASSEDKAGFADVFDELGDAPAADDSMSDVESQDNSSEQPDVVAADEELPDGNDTSILVEEDPNIPTSEVDTLVEFASAPANGETPKVDTAGAKLVARSASGENLAPDTKPVPVDGDIAKTIEKSNTTNAVQPTTAQNVMESKLPTLQIPQAQGKGQAPAEAPVARPDIIGTKELPATASPVAAAALTMSKPADPALVQALKAIKANEVDMPKEEKFALRELIKRDEPVLPTSAASTTTRTTPTAGSWLVAQAQQAVNQMPVVTDQTIASNGKAEANADAFTLAPTSDRVIASTLTPTAAPATAGAETARQVASQMAVAVRAEPGRPTEIALYPRELGRVRLSMTAVDTTITLTVLAERQETTDLMRRNIDALAQEFKSLGYDNISFNFTGENQKQSDEPQGDDVSQADRGSPEVAVGEAVIRQAELKTGLDLRL